MAITADGTVLQTGSGSGGTTTQAITSSAIGDSAFFFSVIGSNTITCTGLSSTRYNWFPLSPPINFSPMVLNLGMFLGVAKSVGSDTINIAYSASTTGTPTQITGQKFTAGLGAGTQWAMDGLLQFSSRGTTGPSMDYPVDTTTGTHRLGIGFGVPGNDGSPGVTTGGFVRQTDSFTDQMVYNLDVGPTLTIPSASMFPDGFYLTIAAMISACRPGAPQYVAPNNSFF